VPAGIGLELGMEAEIDERVLGGSGDDVDRTAMTAVAAVGPAARHELLAAEAQGPVSAGPCDDMDIDLVYEHSITKASGPGPWAFVRRALFLRDRNDTYLAAVVAVILEAHLAVDLREERVILAEADVEAGLEATTLLAHQNGATGHDVAIVTLDAEPLGVAVAAVA
jgi:hypothetical protein